MARHTQEQASERLSLAGEGLGQRGENVPGPPWILGHRGSPLEAPENTLSSLRRALELGLDGVEYDLHRTATGEAVLLHDPTLERTTNSSGLLSERSLPELANVDAGSWFHVRYAGEPLPLLEDALCLPGNQAGRFPQHMIELKEAGLVAEVARQLRELRQPLSVRIASFNREVCLEARDHDQPVMLLAVEANEEDLAFVRDERLAAYSVGPGGWRALEGVRQQAGRPLEWPCERWSWAVDEPEDLWAACRAPLHGFNTNEPLRALATRALCALAPRWEGGYPLRAGELVVEPARFRLGRGEWCGAWQVPVEFENPCEFPVRVRFAVFVRRGAFEWDALPKVQALRPGERCNFELRLTGGSFSPGGDPLLAAQIAWRAARGRPAGSLTLDVPLERVRHARLSAATLRLAMLCERPGQLPASMTVRRLGQSLVLAVEDPGGLRDLEIHARLGALTLRGAKSLRLPLPKLLDPAQGWSFSCGFQGRDLALRTSPRRLRRWAGGIPNEIGTGRPGRLFPAGG